MLQKLRQKPKQKPMLVTLAMTTGLVVVNVSNSRGVKIFLLQFLLLLN